MITKTAKLAIGRNVLTAPIRLIGKAVLGGANIASKPITAYGRQLVKNPKGTLKATMYTAGAGATAATFIPKYVNHVNIDNTPRTYMHYGAIKEI